MDENIDKELLLRLLNDWLFERQALEKIYDDMHPHTDLLKVAIEWIKRHE